MLARMLPVTSTRYKRLIITRLLWYFEQQRGFPAFPPIFYHTCSRRLIPPQDFRFGCARIKNPCLIISPCNSGFLIRILISHLDFGCPRNRTQRLRLNKIVSSFGLKQHRVPSVLWFTTPLFFRSTFSYKGFRMIDPLLLSQGQSSSIHQSPVLTFYIIKNYYLYYFLSYY